MAKHRNKIFISLCMSIIMVSISIPIHGHASSLIFHYQQPSFGTISGHTATDSTGIPNDQTVIYSYGLGSNALSQSISWNISDFTNLTVPSPNTNYQRGISNSWYGSTAGQISGTSMGFQVHKDSSGDPDGINSIYGMQLAYQWGNPTIRPWSYSTNAKLRIQSDFWVNNRSAAGTGVAQYGQMFVGLTDITTMKAIWYCISLWDSRGVQPESVMMDTGGTTNYNVCTNINGSLRYSAQHPNSQNSAGTGAGLWYCAYISRQNLINAVTDINSSFSAGMSLNPNDYIVTFVGCGPEMYSPLGTTAWMSAGQSNCMLITEY